MANKDQIQSVIDECTKAAMDLRAASNNIVNAPARAAATAGAFHIEQAITTSLQAKNIT